VKILALILAFALQDKPFTKDDVLKLHEAGIGEEVILRKIEQDKALVSISAEDIETLRQAGVGPKILARLTALAPKKTEPAPKPATPRRAGKPLQVLNASHRAVCVTLKEADRIIDFSTTDGSPLPQGGALELSPPPGEYAIAIEGWPTTERVRIPESGTSSLTVRGANTEYIDLQTIVAEDPDGRRVVILHNQGKRTPGQVPRSSEVYGVPSFGGPDWSYFPFVRDTVLLGAGIGAIIGHQHGDAAEGAWIGAGAGWFLGCLGGW
jgi:hypothetical protein